MTALEELKQIAEKLDEQVDVLLAEVNATIREPRLIVKHKRLFMSVGNKQYEYLGRDRLPLAKHLAQVRYYRELLPVLQEQQKIIEKCIRNIEKDGTEDSAYNELPEVVKALVEPDENTAEGYARKWQATKHSCKSAPENSRYFTEKGEHVRSKSEVIIADRLKANGIPYHYEAAISFSGFGVQYPDFRVLNKRTRKELFWEHFGMMEDPEYVRDAIQKIENYESDGCMLGRDLIVSFESKGKPLSTKHVDRLIEHYLK